MQTFTPYADFEKSLRTLDQRRLGKQRVEVIQIIRALTVPGYAWSSHPAVLMWKGYEEALGRYGLTSCEIWVERGFGDTCAATIADDLRAAGIGSIRLYHELAADDALPPWLFDEAVQRSHRSSLLRKDPEHYGHCSRRTAPTIWSTCGRCARRRSSSGSCAEKRTPDAALSGRPRSWPRRRSGLDSDAARPPGAAGRPGRLGTTPTTRRTGTEVTRCAGRPDSCHRAGSAAVSSDQRLGHTRSMTIRVRVPVAA